MHPNCAQALDRGINFIDTADTYSHGQAEQIVGKAIPGRRDKIVLATKFRLPAGDGQNEQGGSRYCDVGAVRSLLRQFAHLLLDELVAPPAQRSAILQLVKKRR
jgi:aryl-alcohol dehydrogenase-like predicted oxidoreductase